MIEIAPRALRDAERCARWWREHRPAAGGLFEDELRAALDQIAGSRTSGVPTRPSPGESTSAC
jgi:plasmid stabilization system protein ParE